MPIDNNKVETTVAKIRSLALFTRETGHLTNRSQRELLATLNAEETVLAATLLRQPK